jgi:hypothetical protein
VWEKSARDRRGARRQFFLVVVRGGLTESMYDFEGSTQWIRWIKGVEQATPGSSTKQLTSEPGQECYIPLEYCSSTSEKP